MSGNPVQSPYAPEKRVRDLVSELEHTIASAGIADARTEARDIIAALLNENRFWAVLNADAAVATGLIGSARAAAQRRARGAPFAYCTGRAAFRHLTLAVDERVLIPRQETEHLVELVLRDLAGVPGGVIVDIGTGSGAIALSLATEAEFDRVIATDISRGALQVARANADALVAGSHCAIEFRSGDMFSCVRDTGLRAVVSNPPYVAFEEAGSLPASVRNWEPCEALFSAQNGMRAVERLVEGSAAALAKGGLLAFEVDARRASVAAEIVLSSGSFENIRVELDLAGRERFVLATRGSENA